MVDLDRLAEPWKDCPICKANTKLLCEYDNDNGKLQAKIDELRKAIIAIDQKRRYWHKRHCHIKVDLKNAIVDAVEI